MAELNAVRQELLERGDELVTFRQLVERFDEIEEVYKDVPWNLMQIYTNFSVLIGKEPTATLDKIRERIELEKLGYPPSAGYYKAIMKCLRIIDKYKAESEKN